jgi:hypothetical protein
MSDVDTIARDHAAVTRSWLADVEPPRLGDGTPLVSAGVSQRERRLGSPAWAFAAGFVTIIAVGIVMVVLSLNWDGTDLSEADLRPVELGLGYVWSDPSGSSSPEALGAAFATQVLGWDQATVASTTEGALPTDPVWIQISQPGRNPVDVLTTPNIEAGQVIIQIGASSTVGAVIPGEAAGTRVGLTSYPDASSAQVTIRTFASDTEVELGADGQDLVAGFVETTTVADPTEVATTLVRYLNDNGDVVGVSGGYSDSQPPLRTTTPDDGEQASTTTSGGTLDMARIDGPAVQGYAAEHGVTPEQAQAIIIWQAEVTAQLDDVASTAGFRYAGASFLPPEENDGKAIVAIYIADPTEEDYAAVAKIDGATLVKAVAGMDELNQMVADAVAAAQAEHPDTHVDAVIDPATGDIEISYEPIVSGD